MRGIVLYGRQPSPEAFAETGLDAELLDSVVDQLAPHMDYLRGYEPLDKSLTSYPASAFRVVDGASDAIKTINELTPSGYRLHFTTYGYDRGAKPALSLAFELAEVLSRSVRVKIGHLRREVETLDDLQATVERFGYTNIKSIANDTLR